MSAKGNEADMKLLPSASLPVRLLRPASSPSFLLFSLPSTPSRDGACAECPERVGYVLMSSSGDTNGSLKVLKRQQKTMVYFGMEGDMCSLPQLSGKYVIILET